MTHSCPTHVLKYRFPRRPHAASDAARTDDDSLPRLVFFCPKMPPSQDSCVLFVQRKRVECNTSSTFAFVTHWFNITVKTLTFPAYFLSCQPSSPPPNFSGIFVFTLEIVVGATRSSVTVSSYFGRVQNYLWIDGNLKRKIVYYDRQTPKGRDTNNP